MARTPRPQAIATFLSLFRDLLMSPSARASSTCRRVLSSTLPAVKGSSPSHHRQRHEPPPRITLIPKRSTDEPALVVEAIVLCELPQGGAREIHEDAVHDQIADGLQRRV